MENVALLQVFDHAEYWAAGHDTAADRIRQHPRPEELTSDELAAVAAACDPRPGLSEDVFGLLPGGSAPLLPSGANRETIGAFVDGVKRGWRYESR